MGRGRLLGASALLVIGVAIVAAAVAQTDALWWALGGYVCLLLVPPLIFDAALAAIRSARHDD